MKSLGQKVVERLEKMIDANCDFEGSNLYDENYKEIKEMIDKAVKEIRKKDAEKLEKLR